MLAFLGLTLFLSFYNFASSEVYHITPTSAGPCPEEPCITLSQFAANFTNINFNLSSNTTLIFATGNHNLSTEIPIQNITEFSMFSNFGQTTVSCEESAWLSFTSVDSVHISSLHFVQCDFQVHSVPRFTVKNSTFSNRYPGTTGSVFNLKECSAYITESHFVSNCCGSLRFLLFDDNLVGAVITTYHCSTVFTGCSFQENHADYGGVMFAEDVNNITFINCSFVGNFATSRGGVLYSETGCSVTVYNSTFKNNTASIKGGVFMVINSVLSIYQSFFAFNKATDYGGGVVYADGLGTIDNDRDSVIISESKFIDNSAAFGGVLIASDISVLIKDNSHFVNNQAKNLGGAVDLSGGSLKIDNSVFSNNTAKYIGGAVYSDSAKVDIKATLLISNRADIGGALYTINVNTNISSCDFVNNTAELAGGVICAEYDNHIEISTCTFKGNHAQNGAVIFSSDKTSIKSYNIVMKRNSASQGIMYFIESSATFTGNTTMSDNFESLIFYDSDVIFNGTTRIVNGVTYKRQLITLEGGAITAFRSNVELKGIMIIKNNSATNGGAICAVSSTVHAYGDISVFNNTASYSGGGMYLYQSELNCKSMSSLQFSSNIAMEKGGGIHAISSTIISEDGFTRYLGSKLILINNAATRVGGGICLENNAKLNIKVWDRNKCHDIRKYDEHTISFEGNSADYGGALYVADDTISGTCSASKSQSTVTECFFQTLKLEKVADYPIMKSTKPFYVKFTNNHARIHGPDLFGGLLDRCTQSPFNDAFLNKTNQLNDVNALEYLLRHSNINTSDSISSDPVQVCFCHLNKPNCTYQQFPVKARKGETFTVPLVAVDQAYHSVGATIRSIPKSNASGIGEGQLLQSTTDSCTDLTFNVFSPHESEELILYADGPCKDAPLSQRKIQIKFLPCSCSIGFQPKVSDRIKCVCECDSKIARYIATCDFETKTFIREGDSWITYINVTANFSDYLIYPHCPLDYCKDHSEKTKLNLNSPNGVDVQCTQFRTGILCGACQSNVSISLGSSRCMVCPRYWPAVLIVILIAASLAGALLVALILILNLTVAIGTLNGVIFYANIVNANIRTFFPSSQPSFFSVFISWLNLDIGLDTCFFPGMDAYSKTWLQLVFPTYVIFLVVMVIFISERSKRFSELIGKKNPVATLATLILLSYTKLLHTIIAALSSAVLNYPGPNGGYKVSVWLPDATVEYLKGKHIVLFLAAILILLVGIAYTTLLFTWQWLVRFSDNRLFCWTRNQKLHLFITETYHAPYTPKNRYWTGLLLFTRVILYIASAANVSGDPKVNLLTTGCVMLALLLTNQISGIGSRVYKKWPVEILEVICHTNLALLCLATLFCLEDKGMKMTVTNISMSVTFVLLLGILLYHLITELIASLCKKCSLFQSLDARRRLQKENNANTEMSTAFTSSVIDRPREIVNISHDPQLRESLLDCSDDDKVPAY